MKLGDLRTRRHVSRISATYFQPFQELPKNLWQYVSVEQSFHCMIKRLFTWNVGQINARTRRIIIQNHLTDAVKCESLENVLQINCNPFNCETVKNREQPIFHLPPNGNLQGTVEPVLDHLQHRRSSMKFPQLKISIENPISQDFKNLPEFYAFWVVVEILAENLVDVGRIAGDQHVHVRKPRPFDLECSAGGSQDVGDIAVESMRIAENSRKHYQNWPVRWNWTPFLLPFEET